MEQRIARYTDAIAPKRITTVMNKNKMWRSKIGVIILIGALLGGCKGQQLSEVEQMKPAMAEDTESRRTPNNYEGEEASSSVATYSLPKVMEIKEEEGNIHIRLRLNGKCDPHKLKWVDKGNCQFEIRDMTTTDKCMGYQFVEQEMKKDAKCEKIVINGQSYP